MVFRRRRYLAIIASCAAAVSLTAALLTRGRRIKRRVTETETLREEMAVLSLGLNPQLTGVWVKDPHRSSSLDVACDLMQLSGLVRVAVRLVRGVEIRVKPGSSDPTEPSSFDLAVFSIFPWFKVREQYMLNGSQSSCRRRDLRKGRHVGTAEAMCCGGVRLKLEWTEPHSGSGVDEFTLLGRDTMRVDSTIKLNNGSGGGFYAIYTRK